MTTQWVSLSMHKGALAAALAAADAREISLSEWVSRAAWDQAIREAAESGADHPDRLAGWENDAEDRIFGGDR